MFVDRLLITCKNSVLNIAYHTQAHYTHFTSNSDNICARYKFLMVGVAYRAKSCTSVFLAGMFLFVP